MSYDRRVHDHGEAFASDDFPRRVVGADEKKAQEPDLNEITVSDYVAYLFALDTWLRYVEVSTGDEATDHEVTREGVKLLRSLDQRSGEAVRALFREKLKSQTHLKMVEKALDSNPDPRGITLRAFNVRTVLSRGGAALIKAVFPISDKSKKKVLDSIHAASMADTDAGLANLAVIAIHNKVLAAWVDLASETAKSPFTVANANPVQAAVKATLDTKMKLVEQRIVQEGSNPSGDASAQAATNQNDNLTSLETVAAEAAKKVLAQNNEEDRPVTKSEVIGLAVAAATAATAEKDVPETLAFLSAEQCKVAMMTGRVRVSAGAGSGKSTTLMAKVTHLLKDKKVEPEKICVAVFNRKPAAELRGKLRRAVGEDKAQRVQCSTIHSLFLTIIKTYGTDEQKKLFMVQDFKTKQWRNKPERITESAIMTNVLAAWRECYPPDKVSAELGDAEGEIPVSARWRLPPKKRRMTSWLNKFTGEGWSLSQAKSWAVKQDPRDKPELAQAIVFYELYEGFKGNLGENWIPSKFCPQIKSTKAWKKNEAKKGPGPRGDTNDQLAICAQLLQDETILKSVQGMYNHIFVDEAQDMNALQREVFMKMAGHIGPDDKDKNFWVIGDPRQSIYAFRGSKVEQFQEMPQVDNMKSGTMMTNRRSVPEIVEHANMLIAKNEQTEDVPPAVPHPEKKRGEGSIVFSRPSRLADASYDTVQKVKQALANGGAVEDFAVLTRNHKSLDDFETGLLYAGIPYVRKNSNSVMMKQEVKSFMSILQGAVSTDPQEIQKGLASALISTGGILVFNRKEKDASGEEKNVTDQMLEQRVQKIFVTYCRENKIDVKTFNPLVALSKDRSLKEALVKGVRAETDIYSRKMQEAVQQIDELCEFVTEIRTSIKDGAEMTDVFDQMLGMPTWSRVMAEDGTYSTKKQTYKEKLAQDLAAIRELADAEDDDSDDDDDVGGLAEDANIGALIHLKNIARDKKNPVEFVGHVDQLQSMRDKLCIDPADWEKKQIARMEQGYEYQPPPGVYLGTMHSTKGSEWKDVTVLLDENFPQKRRVKKLKKNEVPEVPIFTGQQEMSSERRLAYVALTRAKKNLTVIAPKVNEVTGRLMDPSPFVEDAGLKLGENIPPAPMTAPDPALGGSNYLMPSESPAELEPPSEEPTGAVRTADMWKVHVEAPHMSGNYNVSSLPF